MEMVMLLLDETLGRNKNGYPENYKVPYEMPSYKTNYTDEEMQEFLVKTFGEDAQLRFIEESGVHLKLGSKFKFLEFQRALKVADEYLTLQPLKTAP